MGVALDIVFGVILLLFLLIGWKRGLVRTLIEFVGSILALVVSVMFGGFAADFAVRMLEKAGGATPVQVAAVRGISSVLLFVLLLLLVRMAAKALDLVFHLPLLHQANGLLGAVFGVLKGGVLVILLCALLQFAQPALQWKGEPISIKELRGSAVFSLVEEYSPLSQWLGEIKL